MIRLAFLLLMLSLDLVLSEVQAQTVTDGDTIRMGGTTIRLHGIDAPELSQECPNGFLAGQYSAAFLRGILDGRTVTCIPKTTDRYGRAVALCRADGFDISAWMVRQGQAWAFTRYSADYVDQQAIAKSLHLGIHGANCKPAWEYRSEKR